MKEFKSPVSRLARLFQKSRDNWKEKALSKQKRLRALEIKLRDLSASRAQWKAQAKEAQKTVLQLQELLKEGQKKGKSALRS